MECLNNLLYVDIKTIHHRENQPIQCYSALHIHRMNFGDPGSYSSRNLEKWQSEENCRHMRSTINHLSVTTGMVTSITIQLNIDILQQ